MAARKNPPARCVIPYMGLGGKGSRVEIALTLLHKDSPLKIETIETKNAPKPFSHEPQAIKVGNLLFLSQQMPCDDKGMLPAGMQRDPNFPYYGLTSRAQMRSSASGPICAKVPTAPEILPTRRSSAAARSRTPSASRASAAGRRVPGPP